MPEIYMWCHCGQVARWFGRRNTVSKTFTNGYATCDDHLAENLRKLTRDGRFTVTIREENRHVPRQEIR